jgi:AraC-like DNA-binding protein
VFDGRAQHGAAGVFRRCQPPTTMPHHPSARDAETPVVHPAYVRLLCAMVARLGADVDQVLAGAGLTPEALHDDTAMLPMSLMRWLVQAAERVSGRPWLALDAGASVRLASHGVLGEALQSCASLRQALDLLPRFLALRTQIAAVRVEPEPGGLIYHVEPRVALGGARRFVLEHIAASVSRLFRDVSGGPLTGATVNLPWPRPGWHGRVEHLLPAARYGAPGLALHLPDALLDRPNPHADAGRLAHAVGRCEAELAAALTPCTRNVQALIAGGQATTLAAVALQLGVSTRTVMRRLRDEGSDFGALVERVRRERALSLLVESTLPVAEIALALGYRSASNFARSFRRWHGVPPSAVRAARHGGRLPAADAAEGPAMPASSAHASPASRRM